MTARRRPKRLAVLDVAVAGGLVVALMAGVVALGGGALPSAAPSPDRPRRSAPTVAGPAPVTATVAAPTAVLTGLPIDSAAAVTIGGRRTIVVKVDDAPSVHAHPGLENADMVYEVSVEGGLTRYLALFQSRTAPKVGPVRSVRTTDFDLVRNLDVPVLAFSGGNKPTVADAMKLPAIAFPDDAADPDVYWRDHSLDAPHNLFLSTDAVWSRTLGGAPATPAFANPRVEAPSGSPVPGLRIRFSNVTDSTFVWDPVSGRWIRFQRGVRQLDGAGRPLGVDNVVVLFTGYGVSPYDAHSPEAHSVGSGGAIVLSHGAATLLRWARASADQPFVLQSASGDVVPLPPGRSWVALVGSTAMGPGGAEDLSGAEAATLMGSRP